MKQSPKYGLILGNVFGSSLCCDWLVSRFCIWVSRFDNLQCLKMAYQLIITNKINSLLDM